MRGISWLTEDVLASQEGLCPVELVKEFMMKIVIKLMYLLELEVSDRAYG
jgi:hypothetical protein